MARDWIADGRSKRTVGVNAAQEGVGEAHGLEGCDRWRMLRHIVGCVDRGDLGCVGHYEKQTGGMNVVVLKNKKISETMKE